MGRAQEIPMTAKQRIAAAPHNLKIYFTKVMKWLAFSGRVMAK
jgi:hypothetical protein